MTSSSRPSPVVYYRGQCESQYWSTIGQHCHYLDEGTQWSLIKLALLRSNLKYCVQSWAIQYKKDVVIMEQVWFRRQEYLIHKGKLTEMGLFREEKAEEEESRQYDVIYKPHGRI